MASVKSLVGDEFCRGGRQSRTSLQTLPISAPSKTGRSNRQAAGVHIELTSAARVHTWKNLVTVR
jgi:hypothetical protein